jgi:hypothetical protein
MTNTTPRRRLADWIETALVTVPVGEQMSIRDVVSTCRVRTEPPRWLWPTASTTRRTSGQISNLSPREA